ncbi:HAD family hydrolase [Streptococcus orisasini]|uniref:HAD family hydrolase n=1 Tax=Streptococcus orisasini TaxID=1080071 RepID=UPI00070DF7D0|nr:HAD family phosphatase [Streptococcus orisasini]
MFDGVIFDMDGVLIDSERFYFKRRLDFCSENAIVPKTKTIEAFIGETNEKIWEMLIPDDTSNKEDLKRRYKVYMEEHSLDFKKAMRPEVLKLFQEITKRKKKLAIASSSPYREIKKMLVETDLEKYVNFVISGEDLRESKPHPEIYQRAQSALGQGKYLAVEDSELGIQSAKSACLYTLALRQDYCINQKKADKIISNLKEVLNYL